MAKYLFGYIGPGDGDEDCRFYKKEELTLRTRNVCEASIEDLQDDDLASSVLDSHYPPMNFAIKVLDGYEQNPYFTIYEVLKNWKTAPRIKPRSFQN
jgi:hypothetical protein